MLHTGSKALRHGFSELPAYATIFGAGSDVLILIGLSIIATHNDSLGVILEYDRENAGRTFTVHEWRFCHLPGFPKINGIKNACTDASGDKPGLPGRQVFDAGVGGGKIASPPWACARSSTVSQLAPPSVVRNTRKRSSTGSLKAIPCVLSENFRLLKKTASLLSS